MLRCPTVCGEPGCSATNVRGSRYCIAHQVSNTAAVARKQFDADRADSEIRKMYNSTRWFAFRGMMLARRPICQKMIRGVRCTNPARVIHHLLSPRTHPQFFIDPARVLALCPTCHTPEQGTEHWRPGIDYVDIPFDGPMCV